MNDQNNNQKINEIEQKLSSIEDTLSTLLEESKNEKNVHEKILKELGNCKQ